MEEKALATKDCYGPTFQDRGHVKSQQFNAHPTNQSKMLVLKIDQKIDLQHRPPGFAKQSLVPTHNSTPIQPTSQRCWCWRSIKRSIFSIDRQALPNKAWCRPTIQHPFNQPVKDVGVEDRSKDRVILSYCLNLIREFPSSFWIVKLTLNIVNFSNSLLKNMFFASAACASGFWSACIEKAELFQYMPIKNRTYFQ